MSAKAQSVALAELVEDMDLYPRHAVDNAHVRYLVDALEAGASLPPIVADRKSRRITDGWHRARAYKRLHGPTASVDVEFVDYKNQGAMVFDAVARNARHGRKLDAIDRTRSVLMLRSAGFKDGQIAGAISCNPDRIQKLSVKVASAPAAAGQNVPGTKQITLKRSVAHLEGARLNKSQAKAHATLPGTSFLLVARQLLLGLTEEMIDLEDERLVAQLCALRDELVATLPEHPREKE